MSQCCARSLGNGWDSLHGPGRVAPLAAAAVAACKREDHQSPLQTGILIIILEKVPQIQHSILSPPALQLSVFTRFNET